MTSVITVLLAEIYLTWVLQLVTEDEVDITVGGSTQGDECFQENETKLNNEEIMPLIHSKVEIEKGWVMLRQILAHRQSIEGFQNVKTLFNMGNSCCACGISYTKQK